MVHVEILYYRYVMVRSEPTTGKKAREIRRFKKNSSKLPTGDRFPVWRLRGLGCGRLQLLLPLSPLHRQQLVPLTPQKGRPLLHLLRFNLQQLKKKIKTLFVSGSSRVHNFGRMHGFEIEVLRPQPVVPHTFLHSYYILFFEEENLVLSYSGRLLFLHWDFFRVLHNDPSATQDHCGRCRIWKKLG